MLCLLQHTHGSAVTHSFQVYMVEFVCNKAYLLYGWILSSVSTVIFIFKSKISPQPHLIPPCLAVDFTRNIIWYQFNIIQPLEIWRKGERDRQREWVSVCVVDTNYLKTLIIPPKVHVAIRAGLCEFDCFYNKAYLNRRFQYILSKCQFIAVSY